MLALSWIISLMDKDGANNLGWGGMCFCSVLHCAVNNFQIIALTLHPHAPPPLFFSCIIIQCKSLFWHIHVYPCNCYLFYGGWHAKNLSATFNCSNPPSAEATACVHPSIRLSGCSFFPSLPFPSPALLPALTTPVSAVCSVHRAARQRNLLLKPRSTWSTMRPHRTFNRLSRRGAAPCSSCPATRAKPLIFSMRSKSNTRNWLFIYIFT